MDYLHSPGFASRVEELMKKNHVPGLAVAILEGERTFSAGYGFASLDPPRPCTSDTLFDIASSSKSMTAASVGLLVRDDERYPEVQYDAIMSSLLPGDFVMPGQGYTEGVTVEDILSHRTGMPRHDDSYLNRHAAQPDNARSVTRNLRNLTISAPIRTQYRYCNMMYTVAAYLVGEKSGQPFADFLQQRFFAPLGMSSTHLQPTRARSFGLGDRIATGYAWNKEDERYASLEARDCVEGEGAGSIITSVNDYLKWVRALLYREHPIDEEVYKGLVRMRTFTSPDPERREPMTSPVAYAAGLEIFYYRGHMVVGHDGGVSGFGSRHFFLPELRLGGAIFGNSSDAADVATILSRELIDEVLGVPAAERPDWEKVVSGAGADDSEFAQGGPKETEMRRALREASEPQKTPLAAYAGEYWNPGYRGMTVVVKDGELYVDARDRAMGYSLTFHHVRGQTEYIVRLRPFEYDDEELLAAEFRFRNDRVVKMGIELEADELIWFDRVEEKEEESSSK
ncbi:beta-lactamase family protein [Nemania sp. NC0429]|nr:beta-lactamase family protein [Nemania sp. NC0429]